MTKTEIFDEVVSMMRSDAAFCRDEHGADSAIYRARISDDMDDESFLMTMKSYLATFNQTGHLYFTSTTHGSLPYRMKRYGDELYVTAANSDSPLKVGDRIVAVDGMPVREYARLHADMLCGEIIERQGCRWNDIISFAREVTAVQGECSKTLPVVLGRRWTNGQPYECRQMRDGIVYMRLADFADDEALIKLYKENDALIRTCEYLIIDVRGNTGGNDSAFLPLFEFCLAEGETYDSLQPGPFDGDFEINYSERNCDTRTEQFEYMLAQDLPDEMRSMITMLIDSQKRNRGKGFIRMSADSEGDEQTLPYIGIALPRKVFVLTDEDCASSGDAFVAEMSKCGKVTVVGRPTMGILDYSNCTGKDYDNFSITYPTSRAMYLDKGVRMNHRGVPVDVYVPWTPEHCRRDVDLETVLAMIDADT